MNGLAKFKNRKDNFSAFVQNSAKGGFILPTALTSSSWYWENCLVLPICLCLLCSSVKWDLDFLRGTFMAKGRNCEIGVINIRTCIFIWRKSPLELRVDSYQKWFCCMHFYSSRNGFHFAISGSWVLWKTASLVSRVPACTLWKKWKYFFLNFKSALNGTNATYTKIRIWKSNLREFLLDPINVLIPSGFLTKNDFKQVPTWSLYVVALMCIR